MSTQASPIEVVVSIDKNAAVLAGLDQHGYKTHIIKPSELTEKQRETLVRLNYGIYGSHIGRAVTGAESVPDLLDLAAAKREADEKTEQAEIDQAAEYITDKILTAPAHNHFEIDQKGLVHIEQNESALIRVHSDYAEKTWDRLSFYMDGGPNLYRGSQRHAQAVQNRVLSVPAVQARLSDLLALAQEIIEKLDDAKVLRRRLSEEMQSRVAQLAAEHAVRQQIQLSDFVKAHMSAIQQQRYQAGLMSNEEIIGAIKQQTFEPLAGYQRFTGLSADEVIEHTSDELGRPIVCDRDEIVFDERAMRSATDSEFQRLQDIKALMPEAKVSGIQKYGYCYALDGEEDPELTWNVAKVTVQVGELALMQEFVIDDCAYGLSLKGAEL